MRSRARYTYLILAAAAWYLTFFQAGYNHLYGGITARVFGIPAVLLTLLTARAFAVQRRTKRRIKARSIITERTLLASERRGRAINHPWTDEEWSRNWEHVTREPYQPAR